MIVVGGGAAGLMAAGTAAERGLDVVLAEPNALLGKKLRITGKGRCNLTNRCGVGEFLEHVPRNPRFLYSALTAFPPEAAMAFFEGLGVALKTERGKRVFPVSDSAAQVAGALADWTRALGVRRLRARVLSVETEGGAVRGIRTEKGSVGCASAVLCTGGLSYPGTGSTGDGYRMAGALGHTVAPPAGSLVPLESPDTFCRELAGFSARNVTLSVYEDGALIYKELGELLFAHFGLTGPLVLSASARMRKWGRARYALYIDFKPALGHDKLDERVRRDLAKYQNRALSNALTDLAPRSLIPVLLTLAEVPPDTRAHSVTREQRRRLVAALKAFPVAVTGPRPVAEAVVTGGGVDVREVDPRTMASKLVPGLYFAGELLDVDGFTGGFNLQIAWATGRRAGLSVKGRKENA